MSSLRSTALHFRALHVPGRPLRLPNVYDAASARLVGSAPGVAALATASYAVAASLGVDDDALDLDAHLAALAPIAAVAREKGMPLTVDLQDGYGDRIEDAVRAVVAMGAVGINLEDSGRTFEGGRVDGKAGVRLIGADEAVERIKRARKAAEEAGLPEFVVNARSDGMIRGRTLAEAVERGRRYVTEGGALTAYVLGGGKDGKEKTKDEVRAMVKGLDGMVNVGLRIPKPGQGADENLTADELAELGVARISVGPQLYLAAAAAIQYATNKVLGGPVAGK